MSTIDERLAMLEFHMELLLKHMDADKYPMDALVCKNKLSREDISFIYRVCEELSIEMEKQKAEGFVTFSPLLNRFQHALHPNMLLVETIQALRTQGKYVPLMLEFQKLIKKK